jgi:hypothetical protein
MSKLITLYAYSNIDVKTIPKLNEKQHQKFIENLIHLDSFIGIHSNNYYLKTKETSWNDLDLILNPEIESLLLINFSKLIENDIYIIDKQQAKLIYQNLSKINPLNQFKNFNQLFDLFKFTVENNGIIKIDF